MADADDRRNYATCMVPILGLPYTPPGATSGEFTRRQSLAMPLMGEDAPIWSPIPEPEFDDTWQPVDDPYGV